MQGRNVLWLPGTDHAGIATQNVVEKQLVAEGLLGNPLDANASLSASGNGKPPPETRSSVSRSNWANPATGIVCDSQWMRGFQKPSWKSLYGFYEDGLIYRGERLINWCPRCLTALSDIEVEHED